MMPFACERFGEGVAAKHDELGAGPYDGRGMPPLDRGLRDWLPCPRVGVDQDPVPPQVAGAIGGATPGE